MSAAAGKYDPDNLYRVRPLHWDLYEAGKYHHARSGDFVYGVRPGGVGGGKARVSLTIEDTKLAGHLPFPDYVTTRNFRTTHQAKRAAFAHLVRNLLPVLKRARAKTPA